MEKAAKRRIIFMGTPEFGAIILEKLIKSDDLEIVAVYTKPDRQAGRGFKKTESEVKKTALAHGIPVFQPENLKDQLIADQMRNFHADYIVVASYGLILPQAVLDVAEPVNVHASLLPKWRGAAPIQRAMLESWKNDETGISIMKMEKGLDTGPVYAEKKVTIGNRTFTELMCELASEGAELLLQILPRLSQIEPVPQENAKATYAEKITKEDGHINWKEPVGAVLARIRAMEGWPGAFCTFMLGEDPCHVNIIEAKIANKTEASQPGQLLAEKGRLLAGCEDGWLEILKIKPEGRKSMDGKAFVNGKCRIHNGVCGQAL